MEKMKINKPNDKLTKYYINLLEWIKKDIVIIIICCLTLSICFFVIASVDAYQDEINRAWFQQWQDLGCIEKTPVHPVAVNITYKVLGDYE